MMAMSLPLFHLWRGANMNLHQGSSKIQLSTEQAYQTAINDGFALLDTPINEQILKASLVNHSCGALVTFEGLVRNHNNQKSVEKLTYYGYEQLALNQGKLLIQKAKELFAIEQAVAIHRIGDLKIGDMAVWIGVTSAHRTSAFDACRWLLDEIKAEIPVWKQEFYPDSEPLWLSNNG